MNINVTQVASLYAPKLWWMTHDGSLLSIAEWEEVTEDEDLMDFERAVVDDEPLSDFDLEDMSGATEQEFGR